MFIYEGSNTDHFYGMFVTFSYYSSPLTFLIFDLAIWSDSIFAEKKRFPTIRYLSEKF